MRRLLAATAAMAMLIAACGNSGDDKADKTTTTTQPGATTTTADLSQNIPNDSPGVTDTEIQVTTITSTSNPVGGKYAEFADGVQLYFDKINEAGGIYGRELVIGKRRDDKIVANQIETKAALSEEKPFAIFEATLGLSGAGDLAAAGIPTFIWNINPEMSGNDNIFGTVGALCFGCPGKYLPWLAKKLGYTKIGILAYGVSASSKICAEGYKQGYETYYPEADIAFFDDTLEFNAPVTASVASMKDAGVEFVNTCMDTNEVFKLQQEMKKQNLDAVQYMPNAYDHVFLEENGELFEGTYLAPQFTPQEVEPQSPATKEYLAALEASGLDNLELIQEGWIAASLFVEGLKLAGPEFTQQKVVDALNTVTDWSAGGMKVPINWTIQHNDPTKDPSVRGPNECSSPLKIEGGKFVPVFSEPGKPWLCWKSADTVLKDPTPTSFAPGGEG